jgi:AraC-like DNA-binding protein
MPGQSYLERRPVPALAALVSSVWVQQIAADGAPYAQRNLPTGGVELRCRPGSVPVVAGPLTGPVVEVLPPGTTVVGVRFRPGAATGLLGLPASEVVDLSLGADELWGTEGVVLGEELAGAASPEALLSTMQRRLADRLAGANRPDPVVAAVVRRLMPWQRSEVGSLATELGISERHLRRRCRSEIGYPAKPLHRVLRFQGFLALAQQAMAQGRPPTADGLDRLAAEAGYADQPHLTRECLRLTGRPPRAFLGQVEDQCGCGHDHSASYTPLLRARPA